MGKKEGRGEDEEGQGRQEEEGNEKKEEERKGSGGTCQPNV